MRNILDAERGNLVPWWFLVNSVDLLTTHFAISSGANEGNFIMSLFGVGTIGWIAVWKIVGASAAVLLFAYMNRLRYLFIPIWGMAMVSLWNGVCGVILSSNL